jgi:hypothetical protein
MLQPRKLTAFKAGRLVNTQYIERPISFLRNNLHPEFAKSSRAGTKLNQLYGNKLDSRYRCYRRTIKQIKYQLIAETAPTNNSLLWHTIAITLINSTADSHE